MQTVVNDTLLNYSVLGSENKNPILILHGWGRSSKEWEMVGKTLSKDYKIILLDLPGFGSSSLPTKKGYNVYDYRNTILEFIQKLKLKNTIIIGHSFGGKIAITISSKLLSLNKLILINSSGIEIKSRKIIFLNWIVGKTKLINKLLPKLIKDYIFQQIASQDYLEAGERKEIFKHIVQQDVTLEAKKIKCQTIIIWGENDKQVPITNAKRLKNLIPNPTLRIVWNSGHDPHLTDFNKLIYLLEEYL